MDKVLEFFEGDTLATSVWNNKYKIAGEITPVDMHKRHVKEIAQKEFERLNNNSILSSQFDNLSEYGKKRFNHYNENFSTELLEKITENIEEQINFNAVVLGGSPMQGIGNHKMYSSLSNCFVVGRPFDSYSGINRKEDEIAQLMKRRGGAGIDLSSIRPNGAKVHNQASTSSGVVPFAEGYSAKTKQVAQYGRRGALMISLCMQHPDSLEFIKSKQDRSKITGANISVIIPDDFMVAVENDSDYILYFPVDSNIKNNNLLITEDNVEYDKLFDTYELIAFRGEKNAPKYIKRIKAREYWETLILCAHTTAEPGILFSGNWMKGGTDWVYPQYRPIGTNPCMTGDMLLMTEDGEKSFSELAKKCEVEFKERGKFCLSLINGNNEIVPGRVWQTGVKKIITLQLDNGKVIRCTPKHVFIGDGEECEANDTLNKYLTGFEEDGYEVINIIDNGEQEVVYDFELQGVNPDVKKNDICHWGVVQGVIAHNCSEIPMTEYDACRLLSRNLYSLVTNPFTQRAELLPEEDLYAAFYEQLVIADLLVDLELDYIGRIIWKINSGTDPEDLKQSEIEIWEKVKKVAITGRRCGAGFTAFGDMLAALGLPYFSPNVTKKLFKIKLEAELDATIDMAILYGKFEGFDVNLEKDSIYMNEVILQEFPIQYQRMSLFGRRNVSWSTAAPVGSGSLMVQSTSGIEPLFEYCYERKKKCITKDDRVDVIDENDGCAYSVFHVLHPKFIKWAQIYFCDGSTMIETKIYLESLTKKELDELYEQSPWFGSSANDLNWQERVEMQSIVQRYTTHAISSTINLPEDCEVSLIGKIYDYSWRMGLKGNTVYRDGSRGNGIMSSTKEKKSDEIDDDFIPNFAPKRPKILPAHYHTIKYKNKTYSIIIGFYKERSYEVFIISGVQNLPEVFDETTDFIKGEIIKDFKDWYNFESDTFTVKEITDVEGDEKMISLMLSGLLRHRTPMKYVIKIMEKIKPIAGSFTHRLIKVLSHYLEIDVHDNSEKCPECGGKLRHENGCTICENGHSKC